MTATTASAATLRRLSATLLALLVSAGLIGAFLGSAPLLLKAITAVVLALGVWKPSHGLLVLAGLGPLGGALFALTGVAHSWTTPLSLAFLLGASVRAVVRPRESGDRTAQALAAGWIALVLASVAAALWLRVSLTPDPAATTAAFLQWLFFRYPMDWHNRLAGVHAAIIAASGAGVFAVAASECRDDPTLGRRLLRALLFGCAALGVLAIYRLLEVSLFTPPFLHSLRTNALRLRVSPVVRDVNAVSALFLLMLPIAIALTRDRGRRLAALVSIPGLLTGLWLAGSRTVLSLLPVAVAALIVVQRWRPGRAGRRRSAVVALAVLAAAGFAALLFLARQGGHGPVRGAVIIRQDLAATTLRMVWDHPLFGMGIGEYQRRSPEYMPKRLFKYYNAENAHNQFFQVLGEMGVTGLAVFCTLLWFSLAPGVRAIAQGRASSELTGSVVGILAFLTASLGQHPLLTAEVVLPFYIVLAVARAEGRRAAGQAPEPGARVMVRVVAAIVILAWLCVPWRVPM